MNKKVNGEVIVDKRRPATTVPAERRSATSSRIGVDEDRPPHQTVSVTFLLHGFSPTGPASWESFEKKVFHGEGVRPSYVFQLAYDYELFLKDPTLATLVDNITQQARGFLEGLPNSKFNNSPVDYELNFVGHSLGGILTPLMLAKLFKPRQLLKNNQVTLPNCKSVLKLGSLTTFASPHGVDDPEKQIDLTSFKQDPTSAAKFQNPEAMLGFKMAFTNVVTKTRSDAVVKVLNHFPENKRVAIGMMGFSDEMTKKSSPSKSGFLQFMEHLSQINVDALQNFIKSGNAPHDGMIFPQNAMQLPKAQELGKLQKETFYDPHAPLFLTAGESAGHAAGVKWRHGVVVKECMTEEDLKLKYFHRQILNQDSVIAFMRKRVTSSPAVLKTTVTKTTPFTPPKN